MTKLRKLEFLPRGYEPEREFRRFELHRQVDHTGMSGTGVVADGVQYADRHILVFPDNGELELPSGWVRLVWRGEFSSTVIWSSVEHLLHIHGHGGATFVVWLDPE